jgi:pimeloyl-ACP methyl ester carboxylesterase
MPSAVEHVLKLSDGRRLGWTDYGDPDGVVVINCHGGLQCRHDVASADATAKEMSVRLVSPDRPGIGLSDRRRGRVTVDFASDIRELSSQLEIDRFALLGWSMGGQYALGVGARLAERVSRVSVIAGCPPLDRPEAFAELNRVDRTLSRLSQRARPVARSVFALIGRSASRSPERFATRTARSMPPSDRAVLLRDNGVAFSAMVAEGTRQPNGVVDDYRAFVGPWGFQPEEVPIPVRLWWGDRDTFVSRRLTDELASRIPHAEFTEVRNAGHLLAADRWADVLGDLARSLAT